MIISIIVSVHGFKGSEVQGSKVTLVPILAVETFIRRLIASI
jgi:hypothetical protein